MVVFMLLMLCVYAVVVACALGSVQCQSSQTRRNGFPPKPSASEDCPGTSMSDRLMQSCIQAPLVLLLVVGVMMLMSRQTHHCYAVHFAALALALVYVPAPGSGFLSGFATSVLC